MSNIINSYYNSVAGTPLLSREEENDLATKVQKWKNNRKAGEATRRIGLESKDKMIKANLRLVIKIAYQYKGNGLEVPDLISEGNMGLIQGIDRFDPRRGAKLSTYCSWWIKLRIRRALSNKSRTIRVPIPVLEEKNKIKKFINNFEKENDREPSFEEIRKKFKFSEEKLQRLLESGQHIQSLDGSTDDEDSFALGDLIEDSSSQNPSLSAEIKDNEKLLERVLEKLGDREKLIIIKRFGLSNQNKQTLEQIGKICGVTRERVRQVETIAMRKLRFYVKKEIRNGL